MSRKRSIFDFGRRRVSEQEDALRRHQEALLREPAPNQHFCSGLGCPVCAGLGREMEMLMNASPGLGGMQQLASNERYYREECARFRRQRDELYGDLKRICAEVERLKDELAKFGRCRTCDQYGTNCTCAKLAGPLCACCVFPVDRCICPPECAS